MRVKKKVTTGAFKVVRRLIFFSEKWAPDTRQVRAKGVLGKGLNFFAKAALASARPEGFRAQPRGFCNFPGFEMAGRYSFQRNRRTKTRPTNAFEAPE
ncbi:MAG: hypothetical protein D6714_07305 [Bacteroidetes bacterium]|nr:MAG: hypothetical protein D6714_07305 [Bacteroidota bacterium]